MVIWSAKVLISAAMLIMLAIRAPHGWRSRGITVARHHRGRLETCLLALIALGFYLPAMWVTTRALTFADYPVHPLALGAGIPCLVTGLWLFHRSHMDLGTNWSVTLEIRRDHRLLTEGIYRVVRHPMYSGILLYSLGQALVVPNWIAGPSYFVTFATVLALRVGPEERMLREEFGTDYEQYVAGTKRLVPGVW